MIVAESQTRFDFGILAMDQAMVYKAVIAMRNTGADVTAQAAAYCKMFRQYECDGCHDYKPRFVFRRSATGEVRCHKCREANPMPV